MSGLVNQSADARSKTIGQNFRCRAWVQFNGQTGGSDRTINGSGNVSSVTYDSTGYYLVNFISDLPDSNYVMVANGNDNCALMSHYTGTYSESQCVVYGSNTQNCTATNWSRITVAFFR